MSILNYTTKIRALVTIAEIQAYLANHGAANISIDYEQGQPISLTFFIEIRSELLSFRLPSNYAGVLEALRRDPKVPRPLSTEEQARRVAWRILLDWVKAQMAIVDAGLAVLPEVFLPYAVMRNGETLYKLVSDQGLKQLVATKDKGVS